MPVTKLNKDLNGILASFGLNNDAVITPFGNGLINNTWLVNRKKGDEKFILQRINQNIFISPESIAFNIRLVADYLKKHHENYLFVAPLKTINGQDLVKSEDGYFRMFPFVNHSHTIDVVQKPDQAYEAAKQFAEFTKKLSGLQVAKLKITLPGFHNLSLRFQSFQEALKQGNTKRIGQAKELIKLIYQHKNIISQFKKLSANSDFKIRVIHHDTKISNVLFDEKNKGLCVIDLDTVMPGYFISDVGDMMRTYLSPVSEEEKDFSKIEIRKHFFEAIINGYLSEMGTELSETEKKQFFYAGKFMIYMQALRFLTDHINNDVYYGAKYESHNLIRAGNQLTLLNKLIDFEASI